MDLVKTVVVTIFCYLFKVARWLACLVCHRLKAIVKSEFGHQANVLGQLIQELTTQHVV